MMYEMARGVTPFVGENFTEIAQQILTQNPKPISGYSAEFNDLVLLLLEKNPANRVTWAEIVEHPWWEPMKFDLPDFPEQIHFEQFLEKYGYLKELQTRNKKQNLGLAEQAEEQKKVRSQIVRGKSGKSEANILRMSLNVGNNLRIENEDLMDFEDQKRIKIDRDQAVDMGNVEDNNSYLGTVEDSTEQSNQDPIHISDASSSKKSILEGQSKTQSIGDYSSIYKRDTALQKGQNSSIYDVPILKEVSKVSSKASRIQAKQLAKIPQKESLEKHLLIQLDRVVRPIIGNVEIEALQTYEYPSRVQGFELFSNERLAAIQSNDQKNKDTLGTYLKGLYKLMVDDIPTKDKLSLLRYFANFIQNEDHANIIVESFFMDLFVKFLNTVQTSAFKTILCTIIGLLFRHTTNQNNEICSIGISEHLINLTKDSDAEVRRRATAALGEYLFYGAAQLDGSEQNHKWEVKDNQVQALSNVISSDNKDEVAVMYALKTIENITSQSQIGGIKFCQVGLLEILIRLYKHESTHVNARKSMIVSIVNICYMKQEYIWDVVDQLELKLIIGGISESVERIQQALLTLLNLYIYCCGEDTIQKISPWFKQLYNSLQQFFEHKKHVFVGKSLQTILLMLCRDFNLLSLINPSKFTQSIDKVIETEQAQNKKRSKFLRIVTKELKLLFKHQLQAMFEFVENELPKLQDALHGQGAKSQPGYALENLEGVEIDFIESYLIFLSTTLQSPFVQRSVISDENLTGFFSLVKYLAVIEGREEKPLLEISNSIILIIESFVSNKELLLTFCISTVKEVLPMLFLELRESRDSIQQIIIKIFTDIYAQLTNQFVMIENENGAVDIEETRETQLELKQFGSEQLLPYVAELISHNVPIGSQAIKMLRFILQYDPDCCSQLLDMRKFELILSYFEINHEKCNANTIKVISLVLEHGTVDPRDLMKRNFVSKLSTLYQQITDIVQGEEILELVNGTYRLICNYIGLSTYSVEAAQKVSGTFKKLIGDQINCLVLIHSKSAELLKESQGMYLSEILEALLASDLLLKSVGMLDDELLTKDFAVLLLQNCVDSDDPNVIALTSHLIHLLCQSQCKISLMGYNPKVCLLIFRKERKLGQELLFRLNQDTMFEEKDFYVSLFSEIFTIDQQNIREYSETLREPHLVANSNFSLFEGLKLCS